MDEVLFQDEIVTRANNLNHDVEDSEDGSELHTVSQADCKFSTRIGVMVDFFVEQKFRYRYLDAAAAASLLSISRLKSSMNEVKTPCL